MLDTNNFVEKLIDSGYNKLCVVPCSFAKNIINAVINSREIEYIPCASEAVACSVAAGLKMSGEQPIVIVQSSGMTNMGSCITSLLKPYGVTFPIITSWRTYKDGDSEIQHQHLATELPTLIHSYGYDYTILDQEDTDKAINQLQDCNDKEIIAILKKDTFSKVELRQEHKIDLSRYPQRSKFLKMLNDKFKESNTLFIGTTGNTSREMYSFMNSTNNFYMAGNMGGALSLGLGASKAGKKVYVLGGDAEFVMHLGGLTTAGRYKDEVDLTYILFDNEANKSTGEQNTYQAHVDYISIAKASNLNTVEKIITSLDNFQVR
jgi:phosphonopyruvate decarboxylase